jgi:hypothetical protein
MKTRKLPNMGVGDRAIVDSRVKPTNGSRLRPKLATTVAKETLDVVTLLAHGRTVGETVDRLVWHAICQRLANLYERFCAGRDPKEWGPISFDRPGVRVHLEDTFDDILMNILVHEGQRFVDLSPEERSRVRVELKSAHETRKTMGRFSTLEDFVRLFVATEACPSC